MEQDLLYKIYGKLQDIHKSSRLYISVVHGVLELFVNELIKNKCKNKRKIRSYNYSMKLLLLNEIGVINNDTYRYLEWFRKLRNKTSHEIFFNEKEIKYPDYIRKNYKNKEIKVKDVSLDIMITLYNENIKILKPIVAPNF